MEVNCHLGKNTLKKTYFLVDEIHDFASLIISIINLFSCQRDNLNQSKLS